MSADAVVTTWPAPAEEVPSEDYAVLVNGQPVSVYRARVSAMPYNQVWPGYQRPLEQTEVASFATWDMAGPVTVEVAPRRPVWSVQVRPTSYGVQPQVEGGRIRLSMSRPASLTVEVNGTHHALHLFANPPEQDAPTEGQPGVRYFGPGIHNAGVIELASGETLYVAGGAVVHGVVRARGAEGIRIRGRGILDASTFSRQQGGQPVGLGDCRDVTVEGLVLRDPGSWTVVVAGCRDVRLADLKLIGLWRYNADGIDIVNSSAVGIERCFVRSFDDSIAVKGLNRCQGVPTAHLPVVDLNVRDCVIWCDWGRALEIGAETAAPQMRGLRFTDCDIVRTNYAAMDIQHGDQADIHDVRFERIRLEVDDDSLPPVMQEGRDAPFRPSPGWAPRLLVCEIVDTMWRQGDRRGSMHDIHLKDVEVRSRQMPSSRLQGLAPGHEVRGVTIENLRWNGQPVADAEAARLTVNEHVSDVRFVAGG